MSTNQSIIRLMDEYQLSVTEVAELLEMSPWTVKNWIRPSPTKGYRKAPELAVKALKRSILEFGLSAKEKPTSKIDLADP